MNSNTMSRKVRSSSVKSTLLGDDENETLLSIIGNRSVSMATTVAQVYMADPPARNRWNKRCCGVICFVKDNAKRSYFIRVYDLRKKCMIWEQELYNQFKYKTPRPYFLTFEAHDAQAALNFANEDEAYKFQCVINEKLQEKQQRKLERRRQTVVQRQAPQAPRSPQPPSLTSPAQSLPVMEIDTNRGRPSNNSGALKKRNNKEKKSKKSKLTKEDIGTPSDFRHVGHVGWDPNKGFDMNNLEPDMKGLFEAVGITNESNADKETVDFIYQFVESHGGIEAVKKEISQRPPPPPPPSSAAPPPPPSRAVAPPPPPPPSRGVAPPPPPNRGPSAAAPSVPPSNRHDRRPAPSRLGAPPPPPPSRSGIPPPPPAPSHASGAPPPPPPPPPGAPPPPPPPSSAAAPPPPTNGTQARGPGPGRSDLLNAIQHGTTLKPVTQQTRPPSTGDSRGDLMTAIRRGAALKPVEAHEQRSSGDESGGIVGALAQALANRQKILQGSDDEGDDDDSEEEDDDDDDDDWED